ncbi:hypothetical protein [Ammoniphilus sp. CFH 90114]|uniref:hypothetical protein n=1 Tax=Ammoniphilus sp. CFH 90114 TaxID=2493665 RepID=UPI00100FEB7C|nr:hypothetical protein [Ammoniphilus sp. CFH 90114]RXT05667.1 hypothetical protein EIZ39_16270 [Ammoniphilus sp. CFH 90114]
MEKSFKDNKVISYEEFKSRVEMVKELKKTDADAYFLYKDTNTGEHYIYYTYKHLDLAEGGEEQTFHHLLPVGNDDVLEVLFEDKAYDFPEQWKVAYLRSGAEGNLVWFNPEEADLLAHYEAKANVAKDKLAGFKEAGEYGDDAIRKLLEDMDKMFEDDK